MHCTGISEKEVTYLSADETLRSFTNYVDKFLAFFDHLPPSVDILPYNGWQKAEIFDYLPGPPPLVNVVCEQPLKGLNLRINYLFVRTQPQSN